MAERSNLVLIGTLIAGLLFNVMGQINVFNKIWVICFCCVIVIYFFIIVSNNFYKNDFVKKSKLYKNTLTKLSAFCYDSARSINQVAKDFQNEGKYRSSTWSMSSVASSLCEVIHSEIIEMYPNISLEVSYVIRWIEPSLGKNKPQVVMIGCNKKANCNALEKLRSLESDECYDAQLFREDNPNIVTLYNQKEVNASFKLKNKKEKYLQYIGIPVCCRSRSTQENKKSMIGLLQLSFLVNGCNKKYIKNKDLDKLRDNYLKSFQYLFMLFHKIEKTYMVSYKK